MKERLIAWLTKNGAQMLPPTNCYEMARFIARGQTCIIYVGRRGVTASGPAYEILEAFKSGKPYQMGDKQKPRTPMAKLRSVLLQRDGNRCFFCHEVMTDRYTVEHLVARAKGGPDHQDNLVLAHEDCNTEAANMPLIEKIKLRERNHVELSRMR